MNHSNLSTLVINHLKDPSNTWKGLIQAITQLNQRNSQTSKTSNLMWTEQCSLNFPMLYLASIYLYIYAQQRGITTFLFATRDCCHWYRIFKSMFPQTNSTYLHCSRNMFGKAFRVNNPDYNEYVKSCINRDLVKHDNPQISSELFINQLKHCVYVDLHGTGQHMFSYFHRTFDVVPYCFLLSTGVKNYRHLPKNVKKIMKTDPDRLISLVFNVNGGPIEMLNYDVIGTLQDYSTLGPRRDPLEYSLKTIQPYHHCIDTIVQHLVPLNLREINHRYNLDQIQSQLQHIFAINQNNRTIIQQSVHHIGRHQKTIDPNQPKITTKSPKITTKSHKH